MRKLLPLLILALLNISNAYAEIWKPIELSSVRLKGERLIRPNHFQAFQLDVVAFRQRWINAPVLDASNVRSQSVVISIPMPDGTLADFAVFQNQVLPTQLKQKYPSLSTYSGQGITDPNAFAVFDFTERGFHAMILSPNGTYFIDPVTLSDPNYYLAYYKRDFVTDKRFECLTESLKPVTDLNPKCAVGQTMNRSVGSQLKTYRLAMAATGEYSAFHGGTVAGALSAIVTSVNRVSGIYERDLAIRLTLIPNTDTLIYLNPNTDPYTNNSGGTMLGQNQTTVNNIIGGFNYDIGHVFSTGGGGIAGLGVVCNFSNKARGVTGSPSPVGDPFDVDYVAHEVGHQFGGNHTFNCEIGACSGNRAFNAAYEPGSGSTIMAYAGICGNNNLQTNSDDYFHAKSFDEIIIYTTTGFGSNCPQVSSTGNTPPVINPIQARIIPYLTPFRMTADAFDPDGDPITYCWEQYDLGPAGTWSAPTGNAPIFRSYDPTSSPTRLFPRLSNILNNSQTIGDVKPSYARILNFRLTVRDNRLNGGGVTNNDTTFQVQVINTGQAFAITSQNATGVVWAAGSNETITWDVGGSDLAPISNPLVNILLSTDGGQTFPIVLASQVPNNGSFQVQVPFVNTSTARVMVEGDGNIFFDINDRNFTIGITSLNEAMAAFPVSVSPNPANGSFEIQVSETQFEHMLLLSDLKGKSVMELPMTGVVTSVDISGLSKGLYLYKVVRSDGAWVNGKLVVQ
ncbi:MAG: reprolysin-like metallopeptidase [Arcticibacter sp.]